MKLSYIRLCTVCKRLCPASGEITPCNIKKHRFELLTDQDLTAFRPKQLDCKHYHD